MTTNRSLAAVGMLTLSLGFAGCSHKYSADDAALDGTGVTTELLAPRPGDGSGQDFRRARQIFPLAVGNHWDYHVRMRNEIITDAGPQPPVVEEATATIAITGTRQVGDREYFAQEVTQESPGKPGLGTTFLVRQSRLGLFELDAAQPQEGVTVDGAPADPAGADLIANVDRSITDPARRAAFHRAAVELAAKLSLLRPAVGRHPQAGADPGEITVLSYPLYVGARWIVRADPRFARMVVARERIALPLGTFPAWKLRGTAELFGPEDRLHLWYSNLGLLRIRFHGVSDAVDDTGNVIGRVVFDSDQSLTDIHLAGRGSSLAAGPGE
jgi:hypothetical protein